MKLAITLEAGDKNQSFRPGDVVRGALEIRNGVFKELPSITATFRGRVRVVSQPRRNMPAEYATHMLFEKSQDITAIARAAATAELTTDACLAASEPSYSAPFEFTFPSSSTGCPCQLPPSLNKVSSLTRVRVEYNLVVALRRRVMCRVRRTKKAQRELLFRSEPAIVHLEASTVGCLPANKLCPKMNETLREANKARLKDPDWLPPYTPSLLVEVMLPSPPVLMTGRAVPIRLVLHTPSELLEGDKIYLRSVVVQLKSSIAGSVNSIFSYSTETAHWWSSKGYIHIDKRRFELNSGAWGNCTVPDTLATCSSCVLGLTHAVEVMAGISRGDDHTIQYVSTSLNVLVMDPPPDYNPRVPV